MCVAAVIWPDIDPNPDIIIKDSKKCSEKYRKKCYDYIIENCIDYSIQLVSHEEIDKKNILQCMIILSKTMMNFGQIKHKGSIGLKNLQK